jgi:hypothetical protein
MKIASHSQTTPTMIHFYKGGSTVGTITVSSGGTTSYNTTSDLRVKLQIKNLGMVWRKSTAYYQSLLSSITATVRAVLASSHKMLNRTRYMAPAM